jgi:hypothetical protein
LRHSVIRNAAAFALLLGAVVPVGCAQPADPPASVSAMVLHDPLAGLPFAAGANAFEPAPGDLIAQCPELANDRYTQKLWVFAAAKADAQTYLLIAGSFQPRRAGDAPVENALGTLLKRGPEGCSLLGPGPELFAMPDAYADTVPDTVQTALAADAARRLLAAHGGAAGFSEALRVAGRGVGDLPVLLRNALATVNGLPR